MPHTETYVDGVWYPSVTTIMDVPKPWLEAWREKWGPLAERKLRIAGIIGDEFHRCVEEYLSDGGFLLGADLSENMKNRIRGMMKSFIRWAESIDGVVDATELKVISRQYAYSGTLDAVGTLEGTPIIFDWKTSSRIYPEMQLQLTAYAQAYNEQYVPGMGKKPVQDGIIVHVSKDKPLFKLSTKKFKLGKRPMSKFLKLREMFDDMKKSTEEVAW